MVRDLKKKCGFEKLIFRRQFILGPRFIEDFFSWEKIKISNGVYLSIHPHLNLDHEEYDNKSLTLLGYILDPCNPKADNPEILNSLFKKFCECRGVDDIIDHTYTFGGRWIIIAKKSDHEIILFHDPAGFRQVFYTDESSKQLWCASQPGIIAKELNLTMDKDALDFIAPELKKKSQYWWPVDTSPYSQIKRLLPNHFLDLATGKKHRFWPNKPITAMTLEESVKRNSSLLKSMMKSASNRFDLALSMTAGRDTRLILASSKKNYKSLYYFTAMYWDLNKKSRDISIPSRLLSKLNLKYNIIRCPEEMEDEFKKIYLKNVETAREVYGTIAQGLYNDFPQEKVAVKGNAIPIGKCKYREILRRLGKPDDAEITAEELAYVSKMGKNFTMEKNPFALKNYRKWISELGETFNIDILTLLAWEDKEGSWQAMSQLEWDIVQEVFVPFNCRTFLLNMLAVNEKERKGPKYRYHEALIISLWPELLDIPVNPVINPERKHIEYTFITIKNFFERTYLNKLVPKKARTLGRRLFRM